MKKLQPLRQIGIFGAVSYVTGGIIGGGIFVSPYSVLAGAGSSIGVSLCIWTLCGCISYCGALSFAELGTRVKTSGGSYTYIRTAFGDVAGFCVLWAQLIVVRPLAAVLGSMVAAEYILRAFYIDCPDLIPKSAKILVATLVLSLFVACNCLSVKLSAHLQTVSTVCKVSALIIIIVTGLIYLMQGHTSNFENAFEMESLTVGGVSIALYAGFYAFVGWDHLNNGVEEVTNQNRTMPFAILGGLGIATICYLLANVAYHTVMTNEEIMSGLAVAVVYGDRVLGEFKYVLLLCIAISGAGITNVIVFTSSRLNFAGGRDKIFPRYLGMLNVERKTPVPSVLLLFFLSIILLCIGDVKTIIGTYSFFRTLPDTVAIAGILRIRNQYSDVKNAYKVPLFFPVFYVLFFAALSLTTIISRPDQFVVPLLMVLAGLPVYLLSSTSRWKSGPGTKLNEKIEKICQRLLLCDFSGLEDADLPHKD